MTASVFETYLSEDALALIDGHAPERFARLRNEFQTSGLVVIPKCVSADGLARLRRHFDVLGTDVELPNPDKRLQESIFETYAAHTCRNEFVRALMEDRRFSGFLARLTGRARVSVRKANIAIRTTQDGATPPWHFDGPRISSVIPIDAPPPAAGGGFGCFPMLRRRNEPSWRRALRGAALRLGWHRLVRRPRVIPYEAGSVILFDGDTTYHRALRLTRPSLRRSLLLFFNEEFA